jgi:dipeptidyl aminopeptidase/acylaminoacyl peptidase
MYIQQSGPSGASLWVVPTSPGGQAQMIVKPETPTGKVTTARISPDGKWLAYGADDGGREEVYVTSFPSGHGRWQITRDGGTFPAWRKDGKEIYYIGYDINLYAVSVNARANEVEVGNLQNLFNLRNVFALGAPYDVAPDGKKFLVLTQPPASAEPMALVLNWTADLK